MWCNLEAQACRAHSPGIQQREGPGEGAPGHTVVRVGGVVLKISTGRALKSISGLEDEYLQQVLTFLAVACQFMTSTTQLRWFSC